IPEWRPYRLNLALNGCLYGRKNGPGLPDLKLSEYGIMLDVFARNFLAFSLASPPRIPKNPSIANF
ncbi:hypothetical protein, partial [uncultured Desulfovibrio sp.]